MEKQKDYETTDEMIEVADFAAHALMNKILRLIRGEDGQGEDTTERQSV